MTIPVPVVIEHDSEVELDLYAGARWEAMLALERLISMQQAGSVVLPPKDADSPAVCVTWAPAFKL